MITKKHVGEYDFVVESYNSAGQVVEDCRKREITDDSFHDMSRDLGGHSVHWAGASYEKSLSFLKDGYQPAVDEMKSEMKATISGDDKRISFKNDLVGYAPIVPLAIQGVPNSMINMKMKPIKAKVIDVYYNITASASTGSKDLLEAGKKLLAVIVSLEQQGYRFNVYAVQTYSKMNKVCYMLKVKVKDAMQPIDLKRIAFPLTHTAFFRVIGFDWYSRCPEAKYIIGYGRSIDYDVSISKMREMAKDLFGKNAIWFSSVELMNQKEDYIKGVLTNDSNKASKN